MRAAPLIAAVMLATASLGANAAPAGGPGQDLGAGYGPGPGGGMRFADTNGDGKVSREEAASHPGLAARFDELDANKDGFLTFEEIRAQHAKQRGERWKALDTDGNGLVSRAEAATHPRLAERFDQLDTNKDGNLSPEEIRAGRGPGRGPGFGGGDPMARLDVNGDGLVDRSEAAGHPRLEQYFDEIDANKDGTLSREELLAAHRGRRR